MGQAQDVLAEMLRDDVAPALRELGLKGSGKRYRLPSREYLAEIGIQSSLSSSSEWLKFTVNVSVIHRAGYKELRESRTHLPERPSPNTMYSTSCQWQQRLGKLVDGQDRWWVLDAEGESRQEVAADLVAAVRDAGLPALRARIEGAA
ncbi:protein of unknown function [Actinopolyspora alba]|uniref:DUF4304 domain-containing protein n=1 Tax=Actinopolyspora alba TaxID=673379 RepID=A0A1I1TVX7_9ACTN|nr:DUF4304 domain-containing protein [Actinopolyspora alba]SFD59710.1 protein of unknown function [Actinopolyspora alba]